MWRGNHSTQPTFTPVFCPVKELKQESVPAFLIWCDSYKKILILTNYTVEADSFDSSAEIFAPVYAIWSGSW